jgi:hypothetical protein
MGNGGKLNIIEIYTNYQMIKNIEYEIISFKQRK